MAKTFFEEVDELVKAGALAQAKDLLRKSRQRNFPADEVGKICLLARRVGMPELALRLLAPIVRPQGRVRSEATAEHFTEYGGALIHVGSTLEGMKLLEGIKAPFPPQALLYWSFGCFSRWEYGRAIPKLEEYVKRPELTPYEALVGKANLAAAMVYERTEKAHDFVLEIIRECEEKKADRLRLNMLISLCDISSFQKNLGEARGALEKAKALLSSTTSFDALFLEKWFAILDLMEKKPDALSSIETVRKKALLMRHWETIRNLDYHLVMQTRNRALLSKLYFGTPYKILKERIVKDFGEPWDAPDHYDWQPPAAKKSAKLVDLSDHHGLEKQFSKLKAGQLASKLISVLTSDLYRPFGIGSLFGHIFPDEYYNYLSSPTRIHQLVKRSRAVVEPLGLKISENHSLYSIAESALRIRIPRELSLAPRMDSLLVSLQREYPAPAVFSAPEAAESLRLNYWSVVRWLKDAVANGTLEKSGAARATRYCFKSTAKTEKKSA